MDGFSNDGFRGGDHEFVPRRNRGLANGNGVEHRRGIDGFTFGVSDLDCDVVEALRAAIQPIPQRDRFDEVVFDEVDFPPGG